MTFKSKLMTGLFTMLVVFTMASSSFAQVSITLIPDPSAGEVQTNRNAQTASPGVAGDGILVSGALIASSPLTTTVLRITFPSPITSSPARCVGSSGLGTNNPNDFACPSPVTNVGPLIPTNDPIRVEGASGVFAAVTQPVLNTTQSRVEVFLPGFPGPTGNALSGSFRIVGVRIDVNGKTGAQSFTAALDSAANNYILQTTTGTIISSIGPGIGNLAIGARGTNTNEATASIFTNRTLPDATATFIITEGFASAFRTNTQSSNSATGVQNGTRIRLTFAGIPSGVTLTLSTSGGSPSGSSYTLSATSVTATSNTSIIDFTSTNLTSTETFQVTATVNSLGTSAAVSTPGSITVTATLFPIGDGLYNDASASLGLPRQDQGYPTFAQSDIGPITLVNIVPASTTLLIPLAEKVGVFDTGIAIANTTGDPFGTAGGGAVASAGTLRFDFFPSTATGAGTACFLQTSATNRPGVGIASDGTVPSGATFLALLSQLLPLSNCAAGDFFGYIFVTANFLNAHGQATISDFRTYSLATNVLVMPPPATSPRSAPSGSVENLHF
jgi:hypothetical protein